MTNQHTHQPKGSMCCNCIKFPRGCDAQGFERMPIIRIYPDGIKAVKCSHHQPMKHPKPA